MTEATDRAIWLGTAGGSVARWADGVCTNFSLPLRGKFCQDVVVAAAPDGRVWIGTGGNGLLVWENGGFRHAIDTIDSAVDIDPWQQPVQPARRNIGHLRNGDSGGSQVARGGGAQTQAGIG